MLVVDDDPAIRAFLRRVLEAEGCTVMEAEDGRVALERMYEQAPGAILLDLMMPVMDGFEVLSALHDRADWRQIPVVIITAKELTAEDRERLNGRVIRVLQKGCACRGGAARRSARAARHIDPPPQRKQRMTEDPAGRRQRDEPRHAVAAAGSARATRWSSRWTAKRASAWRGPGGCDLILMDMSLPEMDGWEATRRLKAGAADRRQSRSSRSRRTRWRRPRKAMEAGCDDYDTKPVELEPAARQDRGAARRGRHERDMTTPKRVGAPAARAAHAAQSHHRLQRDAAGGCGASRRRRTCCGAAPLHEQAQRPLARRQ